MSKNTERPIDALRARNYIILKHLEIDGKSKYLKAYAPSGVAVYIYIDTENVVHLDRESKFVVKTFNRSSSYLSDSHYNILNQASDASGMMYECPDEICSILQKNDRTLDKKVFRLFEESSSFLIPEGEILGYPLIRYSEILTDPEGANQRIDNLSEIIREKEIKTMTLTHSRFESCLSELSKKLVMFKNLSTGLSAKLKHQRELINQAETTPESQDKLKLNVCLRETLQRRVISLDQQFYSTFSELQKILAELNMVSEIMSDIDGAVGSRSDPYILDYNCISSYL